MEKRIFRKKILRISRFLAKFAKLNSSLDRRKCPMAKIKIGESRKLMPSKFVEIDELWSNKVPFDLRFLETTDYFCHFFKQKILSFT